MEKIPGIFHNDYTSFHFARAMKYNFLKETESTAYADFDVAKEKISNLKKEAAETAEGLASINSTIKEYLARVEKLKKLEL